MIKIFEQYNFLSEINNIDFSDFNIKNIRNKDMFDYIYSFAPKTLKEYINNLKTIDQRRDYHEEGNVYNHTKAVTNRLSDTKNINLIISGFLHDTGKDRTQKIEKGIIMQPGHEIYSAQLMDIGSPWREWVKRLGGNPNIIRFIIRNHMRMKDMDNNNKNKKWFNNLKQQYKYYLNTFNEQDYGGHFSDN